jgi:hypothetical protein
MCCVLADCGRNGHPNRQWLRHVHWCGGVGVKLTALLVARHTQNCTSCVNASTSGNAGQAAYQFKLFTGLEDDVTEVMRDATLPTL